jgi:hypothetical protein
MEKGFMNRESQVKDLLYKKFDHRRVDSVINHFLESIKGFEDNDWEKSLIKAGKFIEAIVKLLWLYCGETLPRPREFKAGNYAQKITNINKKDLPEDELRVQIPRACIFAYDIASNRGARHDSEELDSNELDATCATSTCSWILAELVRFSAKEDIDTDKAKEIVDSLIKRKYPTFEEIDGRIYVDSKKYKSAPQCALLILYRLYPRRVDKKILTDLLTRHGFRKTALKFERLKQYVDADSAGNILLRSTGRQEAEQLLNRKN